MSTYIDGYVLPIAASHIEAYRRMALKAGHIWREYGALSYRECIADDLSAEGMTAFPAHLALKPGETVVFAWIEFASRAERDRVNAQVMADPRLGGIGPEAMPFDCRRMVYGGFDTLVQL